LFEEKIANLHVSAWSQWHVVPCRMLLALQQKNGLIDFGNA
jgi:hypothetical protein